MAQKRQGRANSRGGPRRRGASPPGRAKKDARPRSRARGDAPKGEPLSKNVAFPVVGLGASAGGLEAVRKLLAALPANAGSAFVLVQHLDPSHESMLAELLARDTAMPVRQAADGMAIEPNCLYVNPPQSNISLRDGAFRLSPRLDAPRTHLPFDHFLVSLAAQYGERAVCIVLSGTGADGSIGLRAVSDKGGLVIAQDPEEAAYDGMPRSAIATGAVNFVLKTAAMPRAMTRYAQHPYVANRRHVTAREEEAPKSLAALITLLRTQTSHDFAQYKTATLLRRIRRRMAVAEITAIADYVQFVRGDRSELELLAKDLLIHVTSFFRDAAAYEGLAKTVIKGLVAKQEEGQPIRVWIPGCSTGEEAYSIAMLFFEEAAAAKRRLQLKIFASDVSDNVLAVGRNGFYTESIEADVSHERLAQFFTRTDHKYKVTRDLRDTIVFTVQDVLSDPPFSNLDLVSCRNLLIYLQPEEQENVLSLFHFALREGGFLFLGSSENVGKLTSRFEPISKPLRIFQRIGAGRAGDTVTPSVAERSRSLWPRASTQIRAVSTGLEELTRRVLLDAYAPAAVLIDANYQALQFSGPTDAYLRVAAGAASSISTGDAPRRSRIEAPGRGAAGDPRPCAGHHSRRAHQAQRWRYNGQRHGPPGAAWGRDALPCHVHR